MARRVVGIVEDERQRLLGIRRLERLAKLARNPLCADDLQIGGAATARAAAREVGRRASPDHVLIDFADDRVARHRPVIAIPARAEEARFLSRVADEEDRAPRYGSRYPARSRPAPCRAGPPPLAD